MITFSKVKNTGYVVKWRLFQCLTEFNTLCKKSHKPFLNKFLHRVFRNYTALFREMILEKEKSLRKHASFTV